MIMTAFTLAMAMNMAAAKADPQEDARKALNNCYVEEHNKAVADKKSGAEFNEQISASCQPERKTYFDMVVKTQRGYGDKQADAEEYANDEIQSIVDSITSAFGDNVTDGLKMQPEK
jgi:hypothetical protein